MAILTSLVVTIDFPDISPADVNDLVDAADSLPFGSEALADRLRHLADRCVVMLITAPSPHVPHGEGG